jgi:bifunctional non-homologous end joining protein LigD
MSPASKRKRSSPGAFVPPCLPCPARKPPSGDRWIHQIKHDGYRLQVKIENGAVRLFTRNGHDWTKRFPGIAQAAAKLPVRVAVIDGEAIVEDERGLSDWSALHAAAAKRSVPQAILWAFDLLFLDGRDCRQWPLLERKNALAELLADVPPNSALRYTQHLETDGQTVFRHACAMRLEGIVSKLKASHYRSGRDQAWRKVKCSEVTEQQRQRFDHFRSK